MATCPDCGANSRTDPTFVQEPVMVARPVGSFSLAGAGVKFSAFEALRLRHVGSEDRPCGWTVYGRSEDGYFIVDPTLTATAPAARDPGPQTVTGDVRAVPDQNGPGWAHDASGSNYWLWAPRTGRPLWSACWHHRDGQAGVFRRADSPQDATATFPADAEGAAARRLLLAAADVWAGQR